jgi:cell division protein ZapE
MSSALLEGFKPGEEPLDIYDEGIKRGLWQDDLAQRRVLEALDRLHLAMAAATPDGLFARVLSRFAKPKSVQGLYIWGGVGRGKTFLMDLFYFSLPFEEKKRVHFHHFMQQVHAALNKLQHVASPLEIIADQWAEQARVLCFDEFFVTDIGDAMLLGGLLAALFARGVTLVATSNVVPENLYQDGLQRARFLPAIALLQKHCQTMKLDAAVDYRLRALVQAEIYLAPADQSAQEKLERLFVELGTAEAKRGATLDVNSRKLKTLAKAGSVVWFEFSELCETARSAEDYIEIAREFRTVIISGVPILGKNGEDVARRFMFLVDEFYDRKIKLILSAAAAPTELYVGKRFVFEFQRTQSRLIEMQSQAYLAMQAG